MKLAVSEGLWKRGRLPQILTVFSGAVLLGLPHGLLAQQPAAAPAAVPASVQSQSLRVIPLAGNGENNDLQRKVMAPLVVDVLDQNGKPVEGADVIFRFPVVGPSATFANQATSQTVRTNADGQAAATGWSANSELGALKVQVTATRGGEMGEAAITMNNVARAEDAAAKPQKSWYSSKWVKIGAVAGAGALAGGLIWANHGGNSSTSNGSIVILGSPGSPTIGGPR